MKRAEFDFERLEVYKFAMDFTDEVFETTESFSQRVQFSLGDQFRRAALSVCNNIAEGSGRSTHKAKLQLYGYALDSARECIPMITLSLRRNYIDEEKHGALREKVVSICNMLSRLMKSVYGCQPFTVNRTLRRQLYMHKKGGAK